MTKQGKNGIIIGASVLFLAVAGYFVYRGIRTTKSGKSKLKKDCEDKGGNYVNGTCYPANKGKTTDKVTDNKNVNDQATNVVTNVVSEMYVMPKSQSNLRSTPSVTASVVKKYTKAGEKAMVTGTQTIGGYTWYKVKDVASGLEGYLRGDVVTVV